MNKSTLSALLLAASATVALASSSPEQGHFNDRPEGEALRELAKRRIILTDPNAPSSWPAFIPAEILERVPIEDLPISPLRREDLNVQRQFRATGKGSNGRPYPSCGEPTGHFYPGRVPLALKKSLEELATSHSPSILLVRVERQEPGWEIDDGVLILQEAKVLEVIRGREELFETPIRFLTHGGDFTASGVRWCTRTLPDAFVPRPGDLVLVVGWQENGNGLFRMNRYFPVVDGMIGLQPYTDIKDNRERVLADFIRALEAATESAALSP